MATKGHKAVLTEIENIIKESPVIQPSEGDTALSYRLSAENRDAILQKIEDSDKRELRPDPSKRRKPAKRASRS